MANKKKKKKLLKKKKSLFRITVQKSATSTYYVLASSEAKARNYVQKCFDDETTKPYIENAFEGIIEETKWHVNEVIGEYRDKYLKDEDNYYVEIG